MLQWVYSKVQYFSEYLSKWDDTLNKDFEDKDQIEKFIKRQKSRALLKKMLDPEFKGKGVLAPLVRVPHVRD
jgi:hypothetical protein